MRWLCSLVLARAAELEYLSFSAPFTTVNSQGERQVSKTWRASGSTAVHSNFARLTPDRQSKKGALWSTKAIGTTELSVSVKFRISGQGKKYFGDGMAFWITDLRSAKSGDFHGSTEKFNGIGIIIDTFKNAELLSYHKDVTVVVNDGSKDVEEMLSNSVGCNGDIRYHEDRGDFSIASSSRIKFTITDTLDVYLDASNSGEYKECASLKVDLNLAKSYLGISASTGQLADNHDILELMAFSDKEVHNEVESDAVTEYFTPGEGINLERFDRIEASIDELFHKFQHLQHHLEHEMVAVDDHVRTTIEKLSKQEESAEVRIEDLEAKVQSTVEDSLTGRISALENAMRDAVQKRIKNVEQNYMAKLSDTVSDQLKNTGRGWTLPFLFLVVVDLIAAFAIRNWYIKFKKSHLL